MAQANQTETTADDNFGYPITEVLAEAPAAVVEKPANARDMVNQAIKEVTVNEETGKLEYPTDMDPLLVEAVAAEKKYRDTQSSYTKTQMSNKELEAEVQALREQVANGTSKSLELEPEEAERLDDLKYSDPAAWRLELNKLEETKRNEVQGKLNEATEAAKGEAGKAFELDRRLQILTDFNAEREVPINDEVIENDIPPRITRKLREGKISFEDFLSEVDVYLGKGKTAANVADPALPDLHKATGGSIATNSGTKESELDYSNLTL